MAIKDWSWKTLALWWVAGLLGAAFGAMLIDDANRKRRTVEFALAVAETYLPNPYIGVPKSPFGDDPPANSRPGENEYDRILRETPPPDAAQVRANDLDRKRAVREATEARRVVIARTEPQLMGGVAAVTVSALTLLVVTLKWLAGIGVRHKVLSLRHALSRFWTDGLIVTGVCLLAYGGAGYESREQGFYQFVITGGAGLLAVGLLAKWRGFSRG